jgi:predicted dehydrogenase
MLRVVAALPSRFEVAGIAARSAADLAALGHAVYDEPRALATAAPDFVVVALPPDAAQPVVADLAAAGIPVLTETPAAGRVEQLVTLHQLVEGGACVHVGEQYHLEPLLFAQLAVARSGRLGAVTDAHVDVAHDYHGMSILRRALGVTFEPPLVTSRRDPRPIHLGPGRQGDPVADERTTTVHALAWLDYGDRLGVYEWHDDQYRTWVRSTSVVIRGVRGELRDDVVRSVDPSGAPVVSRLERVSAGGPGNHEGLFLRGYLLDGQWLTWNDHLPARLPDDELSIARLLDQMADHVLRGGPSPYDVAEAAQDQYLQLVVRRAAEAGAPVRAQRQPWADARGCRHGG